MNGEPHLSKVHWEAVSVPQQEGIITRQLPALHSAHSAHSSGAEKPAQTHWQGGKAIGAQRGISASGLKWAHAQRAVALVQT